MAGILTSTHSLLARSTHAGCVFVLALAFAAWVVNVTAQQSTTGRPGTSIEAANTDVASLLREAAQLLRSGRAAEAEVVIRRAVATAASY